MEDGYSSWVDALSSHRGNGTQDKAMRNGGDFLLCFKLKRQDCSGTIWVYVGLIKKDGIFLSGHV